MWLKSILLNIAKILSLFLIVIAFSASSRSFAAEQASDVPDWLRALPAKAKVKSRKWSCRGRARFTCKK